MIKRKLLFAFSFTCFSLRKTENDKTKVIFCFSFICLSLHKKTENDKTKVDFCFSFICLSLHKNRKRLNGNCFLLFRLVVLVCAKQKTIKRKLIFVFRLFA